MFHFFFFQKIMSNQNDKNTKCNPPVKEKKSPKKLIEELSPKTKKLKERIMKRNLSNDNFMKFSWSWTL